MSLTKGFQPSDWSEIVGNDEVREEFLTWLATWSPRQSKKAAILYGPPGVGKTIIVELAAKKLDYRLTEMNASDVRTKQKLVDELFPAIRSSAITGKKNLIFLDEIDGLDHKRDAGAVNAINRMIEVTAVPIVMAANDPWKPFLRDLRVKAQLFELKKLRKEEISSSLKKIVNEHGLMVEPAALDLIVERAEGDLRSALMDLRALASEDTILKSEVVKELLQKREREENIFDGIRNALNSTSPSEAVEHLQSIDMMPNELIDWIYGNAINIATDDTSLFKIMRSVSEADYLYTLVWKTRNWSLMTYIYYVLALGLLSLPKRRRWVKLNMPKRVSQKWVRLTGIKKKLEAAAEMMGKLHERRSVVITQILPLLEYLKAHQSRRKDGG